jgi:PEP-CTERM motif
VNLHRLLLGAALVAVPMQASFISNWANNPFDSGQVQVQNFSAPNPTLLPNANPINSQFSTSPQIGLTFTGSTAYDPNQHAGGTCANFGAPTPDCITNFTENSDGSYSSILGTSFTFTLATPAKQVAFWMAFDEFTGTSPMTMITLTGNDGTILTAGGPTTFSQSFSQNGQAMPWFLGDLGGVLIQSVTFTGIGVNTTVGSDGDGYGVVLANVETPTPEPGTVLLLTAGLGAVGFFARRRKA